MVLRSYLLHIFLLLLDPGLTLGAMPILCNAAATLAGHDQFVIFRGDPFA
jgi:hypothetical protein